MSLRRVSSRISGGIETLEDFAKHIDNVVNNANGSNVRGLLGGRTAYCDDATGTVVIRNTSALDMGIAFRPTLGRQRSLPSREPTQDLHG
jgi:hypothetical protein